MFSHITSNYTKSQYNTHQIQVYEKQQTQLKTLYSAYIVELHINITSIYVMESEKKNRLTNVFLSHKKENFTYQ